MRIIVMGVSGCGKSTVGTHLAAALGARFVDGDDLHPAENKAKMAAGIPLNDQDRWPWLNLVGRTLSMVEPGQTGCVIACSALKRAYRDEIRLKAPDAVFVHLNGSRELLASRLSGRKHEYMPSSLLDSQLAILEPLEQDEHGFEISIEDAVARQVELILAQLRD